jgi:outer membrane protein
MAFSIQRQFSLVCAAVLVLGFAGARAHADETRMAVVDMQKALQTVEVGKKAKAELEREFDSKRMSLEAEKSSLDKDGQAFKKQSLVMSDEARGKKQGELQERYMKLQQDFAQSQQEMQKKSQELTDPILAKLRTTIAELAKQKNLTFVFEKNENNVLFSQDKDDITQDVIKNFNQKNPG